MRYEPFINYIGMFKDKSDEFGKVSGNGFFISPDTIVTAKHVIENMRKRDYVFFYRGEEIRVNPDNVDMVDKHDLALVKFDTGTGYTFDIEGLKINKSDSVMRLILDNNGLVVYRNNDEVLRADSHGVNAENMTVRKFYVQKPIRMEKTRAISDPTKIGIGLFYVGE